MRMTQPDFINDTCKEYEDQLPKRECRTPMQPGEFLYINKGNEKEDEHKLYLKKGYQALAGSLLWGVRNTYPDAMYAVTQMCRLMSKPTSESWAIGLKTLKYMQHNVSRGIKFRSDGNATPICYYDSSNKADPNDSKSQWGYVIFLFNGPIDWGCKKHNHVGTSSSHNEYMALSHATKAVVWLRQLLQEMGLNDMIKEPTPMLGDNDQATLISQEDIVTSGNKFYLLDYHYAK